VYFENRSTTVRMTDLPPIFGNPSIKSIAISLHTSLGIGRGWRRPTGCMCSVLFFWHMVQLRTKSQTFVVHAIGVQVRGLVSQSPPQNARIYHTLLTKGSADRKSPREYHDSSFAITHKPTLSLIEQCGRNNLTGRG
jgi:hypothetical protein